MRQYINQAATYTFKAFSKYKNTVGCMRSVHLSWMNKLGPTQVPFFENHWPNLKFKHEFDRSAGFLLEISVRNHLKDQSVTKPLVSREFQNNKFQALNGMRVTSFF